MKTYLVIGKISNEKELQYWVADGHEKREDAQKHCDTAREAWKALEPLRDMYLDRRVKYGRGAITKFVKEKIIKYDNNSRVLEYFIRNRISVDYYICEIEVDNENG
jgi:hypothetical protein